MNDINADQYIKKYLIGDIRLKTPEDDADFLELPKINPFSFVENEVSQCNHSTLAKIFNSEKNNINVVVEIGVARMDSNKNYKQTTTSVFIENKNPHTIYLGIDIKDKTFLHSLGDNIFTLQSKSDSYETVRNKFKEIGIEKIDFLFIDGFHSINAVISELWYVDFMKPGGIIGFHDTNYHPGPSRVVEKLNPEIFEVTRYCEKRDDWGISFAILK